MIPQRDRDIFENLFVLELANNHWGSVERGLKIIRDHAAIVRYNNVKAAINQLAQDRASIGANIESLSYYSDQLGTLKNNLSAANSRIRDTDLAEEVSEMTKQNILMQAGIAVLSQANNTNVSALKLLGNG